MAIISINNSWKKRRLHRNKYKIKMKPLIQLFILYCYFHHISPSSSETCRWDKCHADGEKTGVIHPSTHQCHIGEEDRAGVIVEN